MAPDRTAEPQTRSLRLFVAFDVSPDAADEIERAIEPWRSRFPSARWVPPVNRHITVKFLGQMVPRLGAWVGERVEEAAASCAPVDTRLTALGRFPQRGLARVLWAGVDDPDGGLRAIAASLDASLAGEVRPETRPFAPHLTVARCHPALVISEAFARTPLAAVPTRVEAITLYRSRLGRPAPHYEPLGVFPLGD